MSPACSISRGGKLIVAERPRAQGLVGERSEWRQRAVGRDAGPGRVLEVVAASDDLLCRRADEEGDEPLGVGTVGCSRRAPPLRRCS